MFGYGLRAFVGAAAAALIVLCNSPAMAATLVVDNSNSEVDCLGSVPDSTTIGGAVADANAGDTILVCDGVYPEAITINVSGLTIEAVNPLGATILAPEVLTESGAIVEIAGASNVTLSDFVISGPGPGDCDSIAAAVLVHGEALATITGNQIVHARDHPLSGCQNGYGIQVGEVSASTPEVVEGYSDPGTANIFNNAISDYQKGGIFVNGEGSSATISGNTITGAGKTDVIAQNGIEISGTSALSTIAVNTVTGNFYKNGGGRGAATATGVLEYQAGSPSDRKQILKHNKIIQNQANVVVIPAQTSTTELRE